MFRPGFHLRSLHSVGVTFILGTALRRKYVTGQSWERKTTQANDDATLECEHLVCACDTAGNSIVQVPLAQARNALTVS